MLVGGKPRLLVRLQNVMHLDPVSNDPERKTESFRRGRSGVRAQQRCPFVLLLHADLCDLNKFTGPKESVSKGRSSTTVVLSISVWLSACGVKKH